MKVRANERKEQGNGYEANEENKQGHMYYLRNPFKLEIHLRNMSQAYLYLRGLYCVSIINIVRVISFREIPFYIIRKK